MKTKLLLLPLLFVPVLAACSSSSTDSFDAHINGNLHISFQNGVLVMSAPGHPDAHVASNGDLRIGDNAVALTPEQRELTKNFYGEAMSVRDDGIATGKAGAALGLHAIGSVFGNLLSGTPDKIDKEMDMRGKTVETAALHLCGDLGQLQATQGELGTQLPEFKPYAAFRGQVHCDRHTNDNTAEQRDKIREDIRDSMRGSIRTAVREGTRSPSPSKPATPSSSAAQ